MKRNLDIKSLIRNTNLLALIQQILGVESQDQIIRYYKLEAAWILSNLSYGDAEDLEYMLSGLFGVIQFINKVLVDHDFQMID